MAGVPGVLIVAVTANGLTVILMVILTVGGSILARTISGLRVAVALAAKRDYPHSIRWPYLHP